MTDPSIRRVLDLLEIQNVISLYSQGQDGHQGGDNAILEQWDQAFAVDGTTDYSAAGAPLCLYRDLAVWMRGREGQSGRMSGYAGWQHMLSLPVITLDGDVAHARTDFLAVHVIRREGPSGERFDASGAFHDDLTRTPDGWRIQHRRLEVYFGAVLETRGERAVSPAPGVD